MDKYIDKFLYVHLHELHTNTSTGTSAHKKHSNSRQSSEIEQIYNV